MLGETKSDAGSEGPNLVSPYSATSKSSGQGYAPKATLRDARMTTQTQKRPDEGENAMKKDEPRNTSSATESDDPEREAPHTDRGGLKDARTVIDAPSKGQRKSWHTDDRSRSGELLVERGPQK